jgi:hypothetical protein
VIEFYGLSLCVEIFDQSDMVGHQQVEFRVGALTENAIISLVTQGNS